MNSTINSIVQFTAISVLLTPLPVWIISENCSSFVLVYHFVSLG